MSTAFLALIWWLVPAAGLLGAFGYVLWVSKFKNKFEQKTGRSVSQFQRFQDSLRERQRLDSLESESTSITKPDALGKTNTDFPS